MSENFAKTAASVGHEAAHIAARTGWSALHAAIQEPIDGVTQLFNHTVKNVTGYELPHLELVSAPPAAAPGSEDWWCDAVGAGIGRTVDALAVGGALSGVGALSIVESAAAKATISAGIYGATLIPSKDDSHFWAERGIDGLGFAVAAGTGALAIQGAAGFMGEAQSVSGTIGQNTIKALVKAPASASSKTAIYAALGHEASVENASGRLVRNLSGSLAKSFTQTAIESALAE
jgi:hypothetical protein